jgi:hypothetical protein
MVRLALLSIAALLALSSAAQAQVTVTAERVHTGTRTFDPKNPPSEMPPLKPGEAAVTESRFRCGVRVAVSISQTPGRRPSCIITGVNADLRLDVFIWLPTDTTARITAHEEGHRQISELFYSRAKPVAEKLALKFIGQTISIQSIDKKETQPAIQRIATQFCHEYLGAIEAPSQQAQERYDRITDHGRREISVPEAIRRALLTPTTATTRQS